MHRALRRHRVVHGVTIALQRLRIYAGLESVWFYE
jgi:hypothetical protein